jgi:Fe-S-cluster containining protein
MGCSGACCAAFPLSSPLADLVSGLRIVEDGEQIAAMCRVIEIGEAEARLAAAGSGCTVDPERQYHACKHWDPATKLCGIYEQRPDMCRRFPYGGTCQHCGWSGGVSADQLSGDRLADG